jgi:hypothetical protein
MIATNAPAAMHAAAHRPISRVTTAVHVAPRQRLVSAQPERHASRFRSSQVWLDRRALRIAEDCRLLSGTTVSARRHDPSVCQGFLLIVEADDAAADLDTWWHDRDAALGEPQITRDHQIVGQRLQARATRQIEVIQRQTIRQR